MILPIGPEEDLPRKMEVFEFVSHAPSDYFKDRRAPYPTLTTKPEIGKSSESYINNLFPLIPRLFYSSLNAFKDRINCLFMVSRLPGGVYPKGYLMEK